MLGDYSGMQRFGQNVRRLGDDLAQRQIRLQQQALDNQFKTIVAKNTIKSIDAQTKKVDFTQDREGIMRDIMTTMGTYGMPYAEKLNNMWMQQDRIKAAATGKGETQKPASTWLKVKVPDEKGGYKTIHARASRDPDGKPILEAGIFEGITAEALPELETKEDEQGNIIVIDPLSASSVPVVDKQGKNVKDPGVLKGIAETAIKWEELDMAKNPAQTEIDKAYAKQYADYWVGGKYKDAEKNIGQLSQVIKAIEGGASPTGPIKGLMPKLVKDLGLPESADMQEAVEEIVQRNLRLVLGAQFTEKEGERLISRAYNPRLSTERNLVRLQRLLDQMQGNHQTQLSAAQYYEKNRTLKGFSITSMIKSKKEREKILNEWESSFEVGAEPKKKKGKRRKASLEDF